MNTVGRSLAVLAVLCSSVALAQAPQKIAYQGLLLKSDGTPETGTVQMKFAIFAAATGGTELWGETQANVALTQGFYATTLGETTAFPNTLFDGTERFLEISVGTPLVAMTPRMRVVSVPYAIAANTATNVNGGTVNASSISVGGNPVIDSSGNLVGNATYQGANGVSVTGRTIGLVPGCQAGETLKWSGAPTNAWQCAAGTPAAGDGGVITYTADPDGGLQLTGSNFTSFSLLRNCGANQILKWNGSAWACGNDNDTTYGVGSGQGLVLGGGLGNQFGLQSCATGQILKSGGGTWACQSDSDTTYTATVNKGLILNGTGFGIDPCPAGQIMKSQGSGNWACQTDDNTAYDVIVNGGLQKTGNNFGLGVCPSGQVLKSQGSGLWSCQQDNNAGGTVTQIITTAGISGGPITTTGTLSLSPTVPNWTATNPATCAPGEALRAVGNDGTPTCITITGGGTVLQITPGTGIRTTPDAGITTTGTISIGPLVPNWTATGPGTCPAGQAIQSLALDGTANCVTISLDGGGGGGGSVTSVGTGAGLTGGPITGSGTISVATGGITNTMLANSGVTVSAGTGLNGGGLVALGGTTTINLTTPVSAANGGTGIGGPTAAGQFLRSSAAGAWSVATLSAGDIPTLSQYVDLTTNQTIGGVKTFSGIIQGSISGNAGTVTNGVYTSSSYADPAFVASLSGTKIVGNIGGNAAGFTGNLAGDVTGPQGTTVVARIRGTNVSSTVPSSGQALSFNGTNLQWEPTGLGGDLTGGIPTATVRGLQGRTLSAAAPDAGMVLAYNGSLNQWQPVAISANPPVSISGTTVSLINCSPGQVLKANAGGTLVCAPEDAALAGVQTNQGLQVNGSSQVGLISCAGGPNGGVLKFNTGTGQWACGTDTDTTYGLIANKGMQMSGNNFGLMNCGNNQVLKYSTTTGQWGCQDDTDTTYSPMANKGLQQVGTQFGLVNCGNLQVLKYSTITSQWSCQDDLDTGVTSVVNGGFVTGSITASTLTLGNTAISCPSGQFLTGISNAGAALCSAPRGFGYAWVNCSSGGCSLSGFYEYNSSGGTISVSRSGVGTYSVTFNGLNALGGTAGGSWQVTPYSGGATACRVNSWGNSPMSASISCYTTTTGAAVDTYFNVHAIL